MALEIARLSDQEIIIRSQDRDPKNPGLMANMYDNEGNEVSCVVFERQEDDIPENILAEAETWQIKYKDLIGVL